MANGHGGTRPGAGRKRKALSEKLLDGNPGKGPLTKLDFGVKETDMHGEDMPPVSEYLKQVTKNSNQNLAPQIYEDTWHWLNDSLVRKDEKLDHSHGRFEPTHGNYTILERKNTIFHQKTRCLGWFCTNFQVVFVVGKICSSLDIVWKRTNLRRACRRRSTGRPRRGQS